MNKHLKAVVMLAAIAGLQAVGATVASASQTGLLQYAQDPSANEALQLAPYEVAGRRARRRNRIIGGVVAAGAAAVIINEATRSSRRRRAAYPGRRICRKWAVRCDYGSRRSCRKWNRRCR